MKANILSTIRSNDCVVKKEFNAEPWFTQASDTQILSIAEEGFKDTFASNYVAEFMADTNSQVQDVYKYLELTNCGMGFECNIDTESAIKWICTNRGHLIPALKAIDDGYTYEQLIDELLAQ